MAKPRGTARLSVGRSIRWAAVPVVVVGIAALVYAVASLVQWAPRLPGVPDPGSNDAHSFDLSFWSAVYAGMVSSLATGVVVGLIVGLALWIIDTQADGRRRLRESDWEVATLRRQIRPFVNDPGATSVGRAIDSLPGGSREAYELLENKPIDSWIEILPHQRPFLDSVSIFRERYLAFVDIARQLDIRLSQQVRQLYSPLNIHATNDWDLHAYCVGRLARFEPAEVLSWLSRGEDVVEIYEQRMTDIMKDSQIAGMVPEYLNAREELEQARIAIRPTIAGQT